MNGQKRIAVRTARRTSSISPTRTTRERATSACKTTAAPAGSRTSSCCRSIDGNLLRDRIAGYVLQEDLRVRALGLSGGSDFRRNEDVRVRFAEVLEGIELAHQFAVGREKHDVHGIVPVLGNRARQRIPLRCKRGSVVQD